MPGPDVNDAQAKGDIQFENSFFSAFEEVNFRLTDDGEPVAMMKLGEHDVLLPITAIMRQYNVSPTSADGKLLTKISEALKFVRGLGLNDDLPKEVTSGEASWSPKEKHYVIARHRLTMQMVTWITGKETIFTSVDQLLQMVDDPQIKKNVSLAFSEAAKQLGIGEGRREEVTRYIELLAQELACIEAERDTLNEIKAIDVKVQELRRIYSSDRGMLFTVDQAARLMQRAVALFEEKFEQLDAQTGEVMSMLKNIDNQILYIRSVRDEFWCRFVAWNEIIEKWKGVYSVRSDENTTTLRELHRFLAPRYMQTNEWVLMGKLRTGSTKKIGGTMRW